MRKCELRGERKGMARRDGGINTLEKTTDDLLEQREREQEKRGLGGKRFKSSVLFRVWGSSLYARSNPRIQQVLTY